jgi:hypothetical protein
MKTKKFKSMMELAGAVGVHVDTLYKARRSGYCSRKLSEKLSKSTGVPMIHWYNWYMINDPWRKVGLDG